jgi:GH25 family lysozyme M1 (1,4-beta-N-acetylmuramidase)
MEDRLMRWQPMPWPDKAKAPYLFADISSNNPSFNAPAYASAGHLMIMIKATQGISYVNPRWFEWVQAARAARLAVTHYHFCDGTAARTEADHFWRTIRPHFKRSCDRLVIDIENPALAQLGPNAASYLATLDSELARLSGLQAIGYTFKSALNPHLRIRSGKWLVAAWGNQWPAGMFRRLPNGTLWGWQFTDGQVGANGPRGLAGIGQCDISVLSPPIVSLIRRSQR